MTRIYFTIALLTLFLFGCGSNDSPNPHAGFKANKADRGDDWGAFISESSGGAYVFDEKIYPVRPREHKIQSRVFYNGEMPRELLELIDGGIGDALTACMQPTNQWNPGDIFTKFEYYTKAGDFKTILVPGDYTIQEGEAKGCAGFHAYGYPVAGAVAPGTLINGVPASRGGYYMLLALQSPEQLARPECKTLVRNAARNESEHLIFTNNPSLYFAYANDGNPPNGTGHPYCVGIR